MRSRRFWFHMHMQRRMINFNLLHGWTANLLVCTMIQSIRMMALIISSTRPTICTLDDGIQQKLYSRVVKSIARFYEVYRNEVCTRFLNVLTIEIKNVRERNECRKSSRLPCLHPHTQEGLLQERRHHKKLITTRLDLW